MSDDLPTIWEREEHTKAKHLILTSYLKAWAAIMARQAEKIGRSKSTLLFVDGFAGPGVYESPSYDEEIRDGSPILALKAILEHEVQLSIPMRFDFIERDPERFKSLEKIVIDMKSTWEESKRIHSVKCFQKDCESTISSWIEYCEKSGSKLGPAFFFLDQFGYSQVSMNLINSIMRYPMCETFIYLNWDRMNQFLSDQSKWPGIDKAFGGDEWRAIFQKDTSEKPRFMQEIYKKNLQAKAQIKYVWAFTMSDKHEKLLHWLFFCTNNRRGIEEMKKAMWQVDSSGFFGFSDKTGLDQMNLLSSYTDAQLSNDIGEHFSGRVVTVGEVEEYVLTETPAYKHKAALKLMEKSEPPRLTVVDPPPDRKRRTFPSETLKLSFP